MSVFFKDQNSNAGYEPQKPAPFNTPRPITAAAASIDIGDKIRTVEIEKQRNADRQWQAEAWEYYDAIGEIKYAFNLVASIASRIRLYPAIIQNPGEAPVPMSRANITDEHQQRLADQAERAMRRLDSAYGGQPGLLRDAALNLAVTGEALLVRIPPREAQGLPESWDIRSVDEVRVDEKGNWVVTPRRPTARAGSKAALNPSDIPLGEDAYIGRIWRAHPRYSDEADTSLRGLLDLCIARGTYIYTPDKARKIEEIRVGDPVLARDPETGHLTIVPVSRVWSTGIKPVFKVQTRSRSFRATGNHPVLTLHRSDDAPRRPGRRAAGDDSADYELLYKNVEELVPGDMVVTVENPNAKKRGDYTIRMSKSAQALLPLNAPFVVSSVTAVTPDGEEEVWDMTVPGPENFIAEGVVVHNCSELLIINQTFRTIARSRLNAGALLIPDTLSEAAATDALEYEEDDPYAVHEDAPTPEEMQDQFENALHDAFVTPISDESNVSSVMPVIIRGPSEELDKIRYMTFDRTFDGTLVARADRVLERILQGLDVPKDTVTGLSSIKYANAVQIDESLYRAHIEPLILLISDALTAIYLRPHLISLGFTEEEVKQVVVWYDPSAIATRNDRSADAQTGFNNHAISFDTWRRAHGFSDADAPTPDEMVLRMALEKGSVTPEMVEALLTAIAPELMASARSAAQGASAAPIPPEVQQALNGEPVADDAAPTEDTEAPLAEPEAPSDTPAVTDTAPEPAAPPVPLAEPIEPGTQE